MARSKAVTAPVGGSKALSTLDAELAQEVANLKNQIGAPGGKAIKVEPAGAFTSPEGLDLGSEIQVVVLDFVSKNLFYSSPYVKGVSVPPDCYAAGKNLGEMKPDPESPAVQNHDCPSCPLNAFGSGNNGKSKACKNTRELAVLLLDPQHPDAHNDPKAPIYTLSLPPTAIMSFDGVVAHTMRMLGGPPIKAIVTITAENVGTYAKISFVDPVPNPHYGQHAARRAECVDLLFRKPDFNARPAARQTARPTPRRAGAAPTRAAAAGARR